MTTDVEAPSNNNQEISNSHFRGPYRVEITCDLIFNSPLHISTGQNLAVATDSPVLRGFDGCAYLPGSSIRGVLRDFCEREAIVLGVSREIIIRLFGPRTKDEAEKHDRRGRLTVTDAVIKASSSEIRDHVRIDAATGAAANTAKFDNESVQAAAGIFSLIYEGAGKDDNEIILLAAVKEALEKKLLFFGAKSGGGFGAIEKARVAVRSFNRGEDLFGYLKTRLPGCDIPKLHSDETNPLDIRLADRDGRNREDVEKDLNDKGKTRLGLHPWSWLSIDVKLQFEGPMLVAGPFRNEKRRSEERGKEQGPSEARGKADAVYIADTNGNPYLPGTSLRGAIRAHACRIAKTCDKKVISEVLFGKVKDDAAQRGLLYVGEGKYFAPGGENRFEQENEIFMNHVAIDRLTGFAADGKLFNTCALQSPAFKHRFFIRWNNENANQRAAVALFLFTLRDMQAGLVWVGSRTTRGYGCLPGEGKGVEVMKAELSLVEKKQDGCYQRYSTAGLPGGNLTEWAKDEKINEIVKAWAEITD